MRKIRLVTFDVRGTLLDLKRSVGEIYTEAAKSFGLIIDADIVERNFGTHIVEMSQNHPNFGQSGLGWQKWWRTLIIKSFGCYDDSPQSIPESVLDSISSYLIDRFSTKHEWKVKDGSFDLLDYLDKRDVHIGVISNFDPRLHNILKETFLIKYFTFVISSYEAGHAKPDQNIFKLAEEQYISRGHKFDKSLTLHIGDSLKNDYYGAKMAGWNAALIKSSSKEVHSDNDLLVFKNLMELKDYLKSLT